MPGLVGIFWVFALTRGARCCAAAFVFAEVLCKSLLISQTFLTWPSAFITFLASFYSLLCLCNLLHFLSWLVLAREDYFCRISGNSGRLFNNWRFCGRLQVRELGDAWIGSDSIGKGNFLQSNRLIDQKF